MSLEYQHWFPDAAVEDVRIDPFAFSRIGMSEDAGAQGSDRPSTHLRWPPLLQTWWLECSVVGGNRQANGQRSSVPCAKGIQGEIGSAAAAGAFECWS